MRCLSVKSCLVNPVVSVQSPSGERGAARGDVRGVLLPHGVLLLCTGPLTILVPAPNSFPVVGGEGGEPVRQVAGDPGKVFGPPVVPPVSQEDRSQQNQQETLDNNYNVKIVESDEAREVAILAMNVNFHQSSIRNILAKNIATVWQHWSKLLRIIQACFIFDW